MADYQQSTYDAMKSWSPAQLKQFLQESSQKQGVNQDMKAAANQLYGEAINTQISNAINTTFPNADDATKNKIASDMHASFSTGGQYGWDEIDKFIGNFQRNPGAISTTAQDAFTKQENANKQAEITGQISPGSPLYSAYFGTDKDKLGGIVGSEYGAYKTGIESDRAAQQQKLLDTLSARGLGTSGAVGAGTTDINNTYSNILSQALQNMMTQGQQNVLASATGGTINPDYQSVNKQLQSESDSQQAAKLEAAKKSASGWDWLLPVINTGANIASVLLPGTAPVIQGVNKALQGLKAPAQNQEYDEFGNPLPKGQKKTAGTVVARAY